MTTPADRYPFPAIEGLPDDLRQRILEVQEKSGFVPNVFLALAHRPARLLADAGLAVTEVAEVTGFPEMLDGRVKTLHPRVHGGLLARRDFPTHMAALKEHAINTIDFLVVNLYPFEATVAKADCTLEDAIENIDIGGPAMVRSAAKNWRPTFIPTTSPKPSATPFALPAALIRWSSASLRFSVR